MFRFASVGNARCQAFVAYLRQVFVGGQSVRHGIFGQAHLREVQVQLAHLGDALRVGNGVGQFLEECRHFFGAAQVVRIFRHTQPPRVRDIRVRLDAD